MSTGEPPPSQTAAREDVSEPVNTSLSELKVVDYRYTRFVLNPENGLFVTIRYVRSGDCL